MVLPQTMKAIQIPKHGDVDVIELAEVPLPEQKPDEILIKVNYAGVNFIDTYMRKGVYPAASFPFTLGQEGSGTVVKLPTDTQTLQHEEFKKRGLIEGSRVVWSAMGSFVEYISVPWHKVAPIPASLPLSSAAALPIQGLTALTFMTEAHNVKPHETILVHTVAGGLGLIMAQIAKARGATVIGTTSSEEKAKIAKEHGADYVILYTQEDTAKRVLEITHGEGVHAIFDGVGKDTIEADFEMIRRKGSLVCLGNASGVVPPFPPLKLTPKNVKLTRPTMINYIVTPEESGPYFRELQQLVETGTVKIKIHKEYPFSAKGIQQAQIDITGHSTVGKLIVKVADE